MSVVVLGSVNMDVVLSVDELPLAGQTISASALHHYPGGKGANQAIASARLEADTALIGAVGDDAFGRDLRANLIGNKVDVDNLQILTDTATGQAFICVSKSGENSIVVSPGANHAFQHLDLVPVTGSDRHVFLTQFEMPLEAIKEILSHARQGIDLVLLNAAPALPDGRALFGLADILIVNETELETFSGQAFSYGDRQAIVSAARSLLDRAGQRVIVTLGKAGAITVDAESVLETEGYIVEAVDTTGAGDCFCGALAAFLSSGKPFEQAIRLAGAAAALSVTQAGAGPSMPHLENVLEFVSSPQEHKTASNPSNSG